MVPAGTEATSSKVQVNPAMMERQTTNEIGDEVPLMTQNTGESNTGGVSAKQTTADAAAAPYPRQMTFEIREDILSSDKQSALINDEDIQVDSKMSHTDGVSEAKTIIQSKSQASKNYAITQRVTSMSGMAAG